VASGAAPEFRPRSEEDIWSGFVLRLSRSTWADPDGEEFVRDVVHHPGAVAVVPLHDDGTITVVHQFRAAAGRRVWEIPAGTRDVPGEDPVTTAHRELAEEVGLAAASITHLASVLNSPGFTDQRTEIYVATGLEPCATAHSGVEERWIEIHRMTPAELWSRHGGEPVDETTALGVRLALAAAGLR
jgi:ADP-ribose pyrophosphatase